MLRRVRRWASTREVPGRMGSHSTQQEHARSSQPPALSVVGVADAPMRRMERTAKCFQPAAAAAVAQERLGRWDAGSRLRRQWQTSKVYSQQRSNAEAAAEAADIAAAAAVQELQAPSSPAVANPSLHWSLAVLLAGVDSVLATGSAAVQPSWVQVQASSAVGWQANPPDAPSREGAGVGAPAVAAAIAAAVLATMAAAVHALVDSMT